MPYSDIKQFSEVWRHVVDFRTRAISTERNFTKEDDASQNLERIDSETKERRDDTQKNTK